MPTKSKSLPEKASRQKIAIALARMAVQPGEKQSSDKRLLKVAQRFYKGQALLPALRAEFPNASPEGIKRACARIVAVGLKQATYPGCHSSMPKKKTKKVKQADVSEFIPEIAHATAGASVLPPALAAGAMGGGIGGTILGAARGDAVEGLGRGVIRGAGTTGGMASGGLLGSYLGTRLGVDPTTLALLIGGGGLGGGLAGYLGTGAMLGKPKAGRRDIHHDVDFKLANAYCNAPAAKGPATAPSMSMAGPASSFGSMMAKTTDPGILSGGPLGSGSGLTFGGGA